MEIRGVANHDDFVDVIKFWPLSNMIEVRMMLMACTLSGEGGAEEEEGAGGGEKAGMQSQISFSTLTWLLLYFGIRYRPVKWTINNVRCVIQLVHFDLALPKRSKCCM